MTASSFAQDSGFATLTNDQLQLYLSYIGIDPQRAQSPDLQLLQEIHKCHSRTIPFENARLLLLKKHITIDVSDLLQDLIVDKRGGYCFQHNTLLLSALRTLGFIVNPGIAHVAFWKDERLQYAGISHMILFVTVPTTRKVYLVDCGFGGNGLVAPIELEDGTEVDCSGGEKHKLVQGALTQSVDNGFYLLHHRAPGRGSASGSDADGWTPQYYFGTERLTMSDYRVLNYYTSTSPDSKFTNHLVVALVKDYGRVTLFNRSFHRRHEELGKCEFHTIESVEEMVALLKNEFHIELSKGELHALGERLFSSP